jgi:predicted DNA-binding transcriptional regulator AlpA
VQQWPLPGPSEHLLTREQVQAYLGITERKLRDLVADGRFPPGMSLGGKAQTWLGADVAAFLHLRSRGGALPTEENEGPE